MNFESFVGNARVVGALRNRGLPQSSIFAGPEGVGKLTCAVYLARLANCKSPAHGDFCSKCPSCIKSQAESHPDIRIYRPEGVNVRIEQMREMSREAQFRPFEGRQRIFIVDRADRLTEAASNSILKTLEEPPPSARFVLVTDKPQTLLVTIRSRCQTVGFTSLSRQQISAHLSQQGLEDADRRAAFAQGSIGKALSLDLDSLLQDRDLLLEIVEAWRRDESFSQLFRACEAPVLRADLKKRDRVSQLLDGLRMIGEDLYFIHVGTPARVSSQDRLERLEELSGDLSLDWISRFLYHIGQARRDVERYVNPLMCFETLWLQCRRQTSPAGAANWG